MAEVLRTLGFSGADYTDLESWVADMPADLVAADENWRLRVRDDFPAGLNVYGVIITKTTDATRNYVIEPDTGASPLWVASSDVTPFFMLSHDSEHFVQDGIRMEYSGIRGMVQIQSNATSGTFKRNFLTYTGDGQSFSNPALYLQTTTNSDVYSNVIKCGVAAGASYPCITMAGQANATVRIRQNLVIHENNGGCLANINSAAFPSNHTFQNNTLISTTLASRVFASYGGWTNNAFLTGIDTSPGANPITGVVKTAGVDFTDYAAEDYTITNTGKLFDSGTAVVVDSDILGNPFVTNDVGPYAFVSAGDVEISFTGNIADITGTQDSPITPVDVSGEFSGDLTPFTFTSVGTAFPAGLTISSAGVISGTPTEATLFEADWLVGNNGGFIYGYRNEPPDTFGDLSPNVFLGVSIVRVQANSSSDIVAVRFDGNVQLPNTDQITLRNITDGLSVVLTWDVPTSEYRATDSAFTAAVIAADGTTLKLQIEDRSKIVRGTDTGANTADSNAFQITITALADIEFTGSISDIIGDQNQPITPVDVSGNFTGDRTPFTYADTGTAWPAGITIDTNTGIISGTPTGFGNTSGHTVTGTDTGANNAVSNAFQFLIAQELQDIEFTGSIANISATLGSPITPVDVSGNFTGDRTPFTYAETGTVWPSWANLDVNTGIITGTPDTLGETTGHSVTGTDTGTNTAVSNLFNFNVVEADVPIDFPGNIADISGTVGIPIAPVDVSGEFAGDLTPFTYSETGTVWPAWATLDVNTGVITGTPDAAGTTSGHTVTGQDTGLNTAVSNAFSFIIGAVPDSGPAEPSLILEQVVKNKTLNSTVGFVTDPDGLAAVPFTVEPANQPTNGTLTAFNQTSGDYTYVPNTDYDGLDTFIVTVEDALGYTSPVQVDITVLVVDPYELSFGDINIALGRPENQQLNFDDPEARALAEVPSGQISISDFFGLVFPGADTRLLEPFYVGQVTMGANPVNSSNEGFNSIEPAGNNYGTADTVIGIPEKPWEFQLLSEFTISGSALRVWLVGWRDPDNDTIPNLNSSWSFIEWERTDAFGDYLIYRTELQNAEFYNADPYPVTSTTWGQSYLPDLPVSSGLTYEVRAYDWEYTDFDAVAGEDPTEQGYRKGDFGSMTPALTPSGVEIFEMLTVKLDTEFKISLLDPTHSLAENYFLAVQLYDPAEFTNRHTPITLKTSAAIVTRKNDATYGNYTEWSWPTAGGDDLGLGASWTMRLIGMVQNTVTADELAGRQTYIGNNGESGHLFTDTSKAVGNQWTFACRFQVADVGNNWSRLLFGLDDGVNIVGVFVNDFTTAGRTIAVSLSSNADTNSFGVSPPGVYEFDRWINLLVSVDVTKPIGERVQMYVNDTPITLDSDFTTFTAMNSPLRMWRGNTIVTTPLYVRQQSFMWFKADVALDFTVEAERRKFFSAGSNPVDLGPYGYTPTLSEPDFFVGRGDRSGLWTNTTANQYANRGALADVSAAGTFNTFEIYDATYKEFLMVAALEPTVIAGNTETGYSTSLAPNGRPAFGATFPDQPPTFKAWTVERLATRSVADLLVLDLYDLPAPLSPLAKNIFTRMIIEPRSAPQTSLVFPVTNLIGTAPGQGVMSWNTTFKFVDGEDYRIRFEVD